MEGNGDGRNLPHLWASGSVIQHGFSERTLFVLVLFVLVVALGGAIWALVRSGDARHEASRAWERAELAERESRVAQDKIQHYERLLVEKGVISAGETH